MGNVLRRYNGTNWEAVGGAVVGTVNEYTESSSQAYACDYVNGLQTYSTTEQVVGTWIDGKPLYRKVYSFNSAVNVPADTWTTVATDSNLSSVATLISFNAGRGGTGNDRRIDYTTSIRINGNNLECYSIGHNFCNFKFIIIEYTKSS